MKNKIKTTPIDWKLFESVVVYNSLVNETYLASIVDVVQPTFFKNDDVKLVMGVISNFYKKHNKTPNATEIKLQLTEPAQKESFKRIVESFSEIDKSYHYDDLIVNTERFFRERAVQQAILETAADFSNDTVDTNRAYETFSAACNLSIVDNLGCDYFGDIESHVDALQKTNKYISTGFDWLDKMIGGGLIETGRSLYVVTGATNSGKSIVLGNIAANIIAQGKTVIVISMEMSETVYAKRISSQLSKIPLGTIAGRTDELKDFIRDYKNKKNSRLFIKEYAPKEITVNHIRAYIQQLINKKGIKPEAIIVDYINLIQSTVVTGNSYTDVKQVTEQLRALSYIFECPVVSATQLNRSGYDKADPGLEATSESMGLAHTADVMFAVWSNETDKDLGIIHLGMQKNRYGPNFGTKGMRIDYDTLYMYQTNDDVISNQDVTAADDTIENILKDLRSNSNSLTGN